MELENHCSRLVLRETTASLINCMKFLGRYQNIVETMIVFESLFKTN